MNITIGTNLLPKRDPATLSRSLETLCDSLSLVSSLPIEWWVELAEEAVVVKIDETIVFEGRIDSLVENTSSKEVLVFCRDLTSDLVDCPHIGTGEFKNLTPLQILNKVATPFGVSINNNLTNSPIAFFGYSLEEKASSIIRRLGQSFGWVITSDGRSGLSHWKVSSGDVVANIVKGRNADFNLIYDYKKKFSYFKALGQGEFNTGSLQMIKQVSGSSSRYRPHVFVSETATDISRLTAEASRVKNYIEGGLVSASISYYGDQVFSPGEKIYLESREIKELLLITKVVIEKTNRVVTKLEASLPGRVGGV